jgi:hypothetical protein
MKMVLRTAAAPAAVGFLSLAPNDAKAVVVLRRAIRTFLPKRTQSLMRLERLALTGSKIGARD